MTDGNGRMTKSNNVKALKSGFWYTAANFIMKSIGYITIPIFTRLLSHNDFGLYSNYASWLSTFTIFATLGLGTSFISARFDYEDDFDGYISSTLVLSSLATAFWAVIVNLFPGLFVSFTGVEIRYINIMLIYLFLFSAVDMFQSRERYYYEYKRSVAISLIISVSTALLSVLLVMNMDDKLSGRIIGSAAPTILIGIGLYAVIIKRGKKVSIQYWKYALPICLPYIPHVLSLTLLNSMDKIMITKTCGADQNALYSVAYSCGAIITVLITSLNTAFSPWLGEKLNQKQYTEIRNVSKYYIGLFVFAACGIMLIAPELLLFMGGESYKEAIYVMPPVAFGCVCQFMYTLYVNIEQFNKKTIGMAIASAIAALSNYILNSIFIPRYGYIAAAYTTLASFAILLFIHMFIVKQMGFRNVYPGKLIILVLGFMCVYTFIVHLLYLRETIRYCVFGIYALVTIYFLFKERDKLLKLLKRQPKQ